MSKKCKAYSESRLGLEPSDNRKAFYAGWDAALREALAQSRSDVEQPAFVLDAYRIETEFFGLDDNAQDHPKAEALYRLAKQPAPPPECQTEAEKTAFAFGWWKALEMHRTPAQQQEPYGWKVYGVNSLFMGEFAEADAKAEAKRIGGTCIAFPLYTSPPASKPLTDEQIMEMYNEPRSDAEMITFARAIEAAHGIKGEA